MTLEKDKSYPKPPVLNVKRANRDINVVKWANKPKLSMLDNLVTPLRLPSRKQALILKLLMKKLVEYSFFKKQGLLKVH